MTSAPRLNTQDSTSRVIAFNDSPTPLRLRAKPNAPTTGFVDGGWWPRSRDLAAELPSLLTVLSVRLGRIERVSYGVAAPQGRARQAWELPGGPSGVTAARAMRAAGRVPVG